MFYWVLNIGIVITGVGVLVGWLRHRGTASYRDISRAEISDDLKAADELLEDALAEESRSTRPRDVSGGL